MEYQEKLDLKVLGDLKVKRDFLVNLDPEERKGTEENTVYQDSEELQEYQ